MGCGNSKHKHVVPQGRASLGGENSTPSENLSAHQKQSRNEEKAGTIKTEPISIRSIIEEEQITTSLAQMQLEDSVAGNTSKAFISPSGGRIQQTVTSIILRNNKTRVLHQNGDLSPAVPERPWNFDQRLNYSLKWVDFGGYKVHFLEANQPDWQFVEQLYKLHPYQGVEIAEIGLISDERDEHGFVAGLNLLEKKHGNLAHYPKWKTRCEIRILKNTIDRENTTKKFKPIEEGKEIGIEKDANGRFKVVFKQKNGIRLNIIEISHDLLNNLEFNGNILFEQKCEQALIKQLSEFIFKVVKENGGTVYIINLLNQATRLQITKTRFRCDAIPHVKLLPLWQGITAKQLSVISKCGFGEGAFQPEGLLGKGYYGYDNPEAAYQEKLAAGEPILLMLNWYAGKVVYPIAKGAEPETSCGLRLLANNPNDSVSENIKIGKEIGLIKKSDNDYTIICGKDTIERAEEFELKADEKLAELYQLLLSLEFNGEIISRGEHPKIYELLENVTKKQLEGEYVLRLVETTVGFACDKEGKEIAIVKEAVISSKESYKFKVIGCKYFAEKKQREFVNFTISDIEHEVDELKSQLSLLEFNNTVLEQNNNKDIYEAIYNKVSFRKGLIAPKLRGNPHYANYDMHFSPMTTPSQVTPKNQTTRFHAGVVFDSSQLLARYVVTLKTRSGFIRMEEMFKQFRRHELGIQALLFQPSLSYLEHLLRTYNQKLIKNYTSLQMPIDLAATVTDFFNTQQKEVLLISSEANKIGEYLESLLWKEYQEGQAIPLYIDLKEFSEEEIQDSLVEQALRNRSLPEDGITDLKEHRKFNLIISWEGSDNQRNTFIKSNHINRYGGFRGKVIVVSRRIASDEELYFYTEGGTQTQQVERLIRKDLHNTLEPVTISLTTPSHHAYSLLPGGELTPWEYDNKLHYSIGWIDKGAYKLYRLKDTDHDYQFVNAMYQQSKMSGYELGEVYIISDQGAEQAFKANLALLNRRAANHPDYVASWQYENNPELRRQITALLEKQTYHTSLALHVKLLPLWHGTGPQAAVGIAKSGFASLAAIDAGYFGKGLYGSNSAEYSYRVYASGYNKGKEVLILSWYAAQNSYPVIDGDLERLIGKANYKSYDSHFIPVVPENPAKHANRTEDIYEDTFIPIRLGQQEAYQEFVTFQTAQVLPRYILSLKRTNSSNPNQGGLQEFLNTPPLITTGNKLYEKDLSWAIAALKQQAEEEIIQDFMLTQGLSLYITSQATDSDQTERVTEKKLKPLEEEVQAFLDNSEKEVFILQGNSGSGKSLFGRWLEKHSWEQPKELIPLFISLPRIGIKNVRGRLIETSLRLKGLSESLIKELKQKIKFLFILDGYDEIPDKPKLIQENHLNEPGSWQGKIIISCRKQYLTDKELELLYPAHEQESVIQAAKKCEKWFIVPFDSKQVTAYVEKFSKSEFSIGNWSQEDYQREIANVPEVTEFVKEPFLLFLVLNALPELKQKGTVKKLALYQAFTKNWFNNQFYKEHQSRFDGSKYGSNPPQQAICRIFEEYAEELALEMFLRKTQAISKETKDDDFSKFFIGERNQLGFKGCPLKKIGETCLFIHKSFQEYFAAKKIITELETTFDSSSLGQDLLNREPTIINFLAEWVIKESKQELLFKLITRTSQLTAENFDWTPSLGIIAANAATILNTARVPFSGKDLHGVNIAGADLSQGIFDNVNFENANLNGVNFQSAWLRNTNFKNAYMLTIVLDEMDKEDIIRCHFYTSYYAYSVDGKYLAISYDNSVTIYTGTTLDILAEIKINIPSNRKTIIKNIAFNHSSNLLAAGCSDKTARIWLAVAPYSCLYIFEGHTDQVNSVVFNHSSSLLASGSSDKTVRLWSIESYSLMDIKNFCWIVSKVTFNLSGKYLILSLINSMRDVSMNDYVAESIDYGPLETKISFCLASAPTRKDVHIHKVNLEDPDTYWQRLENPDNSDMQMNINLERENLDIDLGNLSSNPPLELDQILAKFLEIPTSSTILLLGECGLGKSLSIYRLTDRLLSRWWAYFRNPEGLMPYFPIFIRSKLNKWSHSALCNIIEKIWSHYNLSEKLIQEAKWLVIIDGYEECQIDLKPQNLPKLIGLNDLPNAKLVVTCRSGAVKALDLHNRFAFNESLMVYYFLPFNIFQMLKYLKNNLSWDAFDYNYNYKLLKHDQKLFANLRNPFMLSLLAQSVKVSKKDFAMLNCWQIYQNFVENYIDTQYQLLPYAVQRLFKVELPSIVESFNKFAAEVAFSAFEEGNIALEIDSYQTLSTNSQKWINLNRLVLEDSQKQFKVNQQSRSNHRALLSEQEYVAIMQHRLNQFKNKLPLIDKGTSYEFVHKSFFEYFVARHIVYLIIKYKKITSEKGDAHEQQIAIEEGIKLLNYRNLQSEPEILNFIVEGCKEENIMVCKEFLLQIIKHSEQISNTHQAYINAHNIFKVLCVFEEPFINTAHIPDNNDIVNLMELFEKLSILDDADTKNGQKILMFSSGLQYTPIQPYFNKEAIISKNGSVTEHAAEVDYVRYTPSVGILPVSQHR